jgi:peroxiredoxin
MNELSPLLCQILLKIKYGEAMNLSKIISLFTIVIVSFLSVTACASEPSSNNIENFTLPDYNGAEHSLSDYKDSKAIVIIFIATECHAEENGLTFTILKDENNVVADEFDASFTPEVYVLSSDFNILYHGRIDNSKNEDDITTKDLENALNEILAGKEVTTKATKAFGCSIKRV